MYAVEAAFLLITATWVVVTNTPRATRGTSFKLFLAGLGVAVLAFALGQARIHMAPAAVVFIVLSLFLFRRGYSHIAVRTVGVVLGSVVVALSVLFVAALPVVTLPAPVGPHAVGVTSFTLVDNSRDDALFGVPAVPTIVAGQVDASQIGLLGMSTGGGAVTAVCKEDARCRAAVNLDGGLWGSRMRQPLTVPYLVVAHPSNAAFFDHDLLISEAPYYAITVEGAAHTNFMDVSLFAPVLQWLGVTGTIEGERVIDIMNVLSLRFFDAYVRGTGAPELEPEGFPELSSRTNLSQ